MGRPPDKDFGQCFYTLPQPKIEVYHSALLDRSRFGLQIGNRPLRERSRTNTSLMESQVLLRALIFDFDGVLVDSEPLIFKITVHMAAQEGWAMTEEDYFQNYLALDDRGIIEHLYRSHGRAVDPARRAELIAWKFRTYAEAIRDGLPAMPGAVEFVRRVAARFPLAIASGSLRSEVEHLLSKIGLRESFQLLVTSDDTDRSKPDPEIFLKALVGLNRLPPFQKDPLKAAECLVIEDAPAGVRAAHSAGMRCLALTHSRPADELSHAEWRFGDFSDVDLARVESSFR